MDLANAVEFDLGAACSNVQRVRPGMPLLRVSSKNGEGMHEWLQFLASVSPATRMDTAAAGYS
jgi:Ni2+-binding GTPase involved in maturation of urease and hydrogenase